MFRIYFTFALVFLLTLSVSGQEIGANFNHNPEIMDFEYLEKTGVEWVRATPRILDYSDDELQIENNLGLQKIAEAGERGYKVAFGFRWDFKKHERRIPEPNSEEEGILFDKVQKVLDQIGHHIDMFKLGNEPNLETHPEDMQKNKEGYIPLVKFTERLLTEVVDPFYAKHPQLKRPSVFVGSFPRLFMEEEQKKEGVRAMISLANNHPGIQGLAVHLHISDAQQIDQSFRFVRTLMPSKPIIVPEFSFHRLYTRKLEQPLTGTEEGKKFVEKYNRNPQWKLYDWFGYANTHGVSKEEWRELFETLEWFPRNNLLTYYKAFEKYGVVLATYPLFQQSAPKDMTANSPAWFINPIFGQKSLLKEPDGDFAENPLYFDDFLKIVEKGKNDKSTER